MWDVHMFFEVPKYRRYQCTLNFFPKLNAICLFKSRNFSKCVARLNHGGFQDNLQCVSLKAFKSENDWIPNFIHLINLPTKFTPSPKKLPDWSLFQLLVLRYTFNARHNFDYSILLVSLLPLLADLYPSFAC